MEYQEKNKLVITPGLTEKVRQFEAHCRLAIESKSPVLVLSTDIEKCPFSGTEK